jgi:hypothetical protein
LWGDELQGWNLFRSSSLRELLPHHHDLHPYLWSCIVFILSRFTQHPESMQVASLVIICAAAFILVFYAPFPIILTTLVLGGYYFLFEYAAFSRGYALSLLFCFLLCAELRRLNGTRTTLYLLWLILLGSSHILGLFLALAFHLHYFFTHSKRKFASHFLPALLLLIVASTFLIPEARIQTTGSTWYSGLHPSIPMQAPLRAFFPLSNFLKTEFWNSSLMLDLLPSKIVQSAVSIGLLSIVLFVFRHSGHAVLFLGSFFLFILLFALVFPLVSARYVGFLYVAFLAGLWLGDFNAWEWKRKTIVFALIILQIPGGLFAMCSDWNRPFSQYKEVKSLLDDTKSTPLITDVWGLNYLASTYEKSFYCIETDKLERIVVLDNRILERIASPERYTKGLDRYFEKKNNEQRVLLFSNTPALESRGITGYEVRLVDKREGAIENFSNIYLYMVWIKPLLPEI